MSLRECLKRDQDKIESCLRSQLELVYLQGLLDLEELVRHNSNKDAK